MAHCKMESAIPNLKKADMAQIPKTHITPNLAKTGPPSVSPKRYVLGVTADALFVRAEPVQSLGQ